MLGVRKIAPGLLHRLLNNSSCPPIELAYESHPAWPLGFSKTHTREALRISVLDSSFNPPTLAHLALANTHLPLEWCKAVGTEETDPKLLLLSVKNADKVLKPGDASYLQRLEMMFLLTERMSSTNVAIAITNEPTFVRKSEALLSFLKQKLGSSESPTQPLRTVELTFLVGSDTLDRLFSLNYYPSEANMRASLQKFLSPTPDGDNSRVLSASRRLMPITSQSTTETQTPSALVKHYIDLGRIAIVDIGEDLSTFVVPLLRTDVPLGMKQFRFGTTASQRKLQSTLSKSISTRFIHNCSILLSAHLPYAIMEHSPAATSPGSMPPPPRSTLCSRTLPTLCRVLFACCIIDNGSK